MFYKETEFKDTPIGKTPKQWELKRIRDVCKVVTGGTPSTKHPEYFGGNIKWLKSGDIKQLYIYDTTEKLTRLGIENSNSKTYPSGSVAIALSGRGQTRGRTIITKAPMACSQSVAFMIPNSGLLAEYLHYNLANRYMEIRNLTGHLDRSGLNLSIVSDILIPIPSLEEQRVVVGVLGVIDSAIELVDRVIWKTERLKKGLMQELLTKGIEHKEYKDTPIGKTPKTWQIMKLGDVAEFKNGINFSKELKGNKGMLTIDVLNMYGEGIYPDFANLYRVAVTLKNDDYLLKAGDILFVRSSLKREGAGWASLFKGQSEPITFCGFIIRARLRNANILPEFLTYYLRSEKARKQLIGAAGQVTITNITQETLNTLQFPLVPLSEQRRIVEILSVVDKKLELERREKTRLERVKQGLMDLLLTGKVGVKVD